MILAAAATIVYHTKSKRRPEGIKAVAIAAAALFSSTKHPLKKMIRVPASALHRPH